MSYVVARKSLLPVKQKLLLVSCNKLPIQPALSYLTLSVTYETEDTVCFIIYWFFSMPFTLEVYILTISCLWSLRPSKILANIYFSFTVQNSTCWHFLNYVFHLPYYRSKDSSIRKLLNSNWNRSKMKISHGTAWRFLD